MGVCDCDAGERGTDSLGFERRLWDAADLLRSSIDPSEYKHVVLPLIFLKYISDAFTDIYDRLVEQGEDPEDKDFYEAELVFWVPESARWQRLVSRARQPTIGQEIDSAMEAIEMENPDLRNVLRKTFGASDLSPSVLGQVIDLLHNEVPSLGDEDARSKDIIGRVYEYFIGRFAEAEKKAGGEFYTPRSVVSLLVAMLQPSGSDSVYDGCCGSGGMFVQSRQFVRKRGGRLDYMVYGQEMNATTWRMAKTNLLTRAIEHDLGERWEDTLKEDLHEDKRFDICIANPPFNVKKWAHETEPGRWKYGIPPKGNANYAWIQHYLQHLSNSGLAGIVMSNGSLSTTRKEERDIRNAIIAEDKLDCIVMLPDKLFTNTGISACIWLLANNKADQRFRDRRGETLFIDCRDLGNMISRTQRELCFNEGCELDVVAATYQKWKDKDWDGVIPEGVSTDPRDPPGDWDGYYDIRGFCKRARTEVEIAEHGGIIVPGRYVGAPPMPDDGEPFEEKMERLTKELGEHFAESRRLEEDIRKNLGDLGFDF